MFNRILVPLALAGPDDSDRPLATARHLAAPGAEIVLLHVIEEVAPQAAAYLPAHYVEDMHRDRRAELGRRAAALPGARAEVAEGNAGARILDRIEADGIDCVVIASHKPGLRDWFLGSTAARVVRHARCSVFVLR